MDNKTNKQNNEADTGATVSASTETAACEQQHDSSALHTAARAFNQKNQDPLPLPEQPVPPKPTKRMTPWGFEVPVYQSKADVNSNGTHSRQVTLEEFWSMHETLLAQPPVEQEVLGRPQIGPPEVPTPVPCAEGDHSNEPRLQEQRQQSTGPIETPPPSSKLAPVSFDWLPRCPAPGAGVNVWCLTAAHACKRHGLPPEEAESLIREKISRPPKGKEIQQALNKAYAQNFSGTVQPPITCGFNEGELKALAYKAPGWSVEKLKSVSPIDVNCCTTIQFLRHVFKVGERVIIATKITDRGTIWINDPQDTNSSEDELDCFKEPPEKQGAWFLSNPVNGNGVNLERLVSSNNRSGETFRSEENLTSFKYLVLESDEAPQDLWIRGLVQLPLPIVSIVTSGGKSLHALIRIDAVDGDHWRAIRQRIAPTLVTLGADKNALTAVRLTRLPGSYRKEKERWQELLYLNPNADETPICQLPARVTPSKQS
jgi:hypothetical protein